MSWLAAKRYPGFCKKFKYSISDYNIELKLNPRRRNFDAEISLSLTVDKDTRHFYFLLTSECKLDSISYLGLALHHTVKPAYPGINLVTVTLPHKSSAGDKLVLGFAYSGNISRHGGKCLQLPPEAHWYPFSPRPQKYTCSLHVITSAGIRIAAMGQYEGDQPADTRVMTRWSATTPIRGIHLLAGEYLKTSRERQPDIEGQPDIHVYYLRKYMNQAQTIARQAEKVTAFLVSTLGPAPMDSASIVLTDNPRDEVSSSLYLTSISSGILGQLREYSTSQQRNIRLFHIITREMAHHWFKHNLAVEHPQHLWYLDGLAEYLSWLAVEEEFGRDTRDQLMQEAKANCSLPPASIRAESCSVQREFPSWLVDKAGWMMRMLHSLVGDKFLPALQEFYLQHTKIAPSPDVFFLFMSNLTQIDLDIFYKEWALSNAQLVAEIEKGRTFRDEDGQWQTVFNLVNRGKLRWPHPVEIRLEMEDGTSWVEKLPIQKEPHLISGQGRIVSLEVDPNLKLLNSAENNKYNM